MASVKMESEPRAQTRLRAHAAPKQPLVECEQCYHRHSNHHPCLFCKGCLKTIRGKSKNSAVNNRIGYHGDLDNTNGHVGEAQPDGSKSGKQFAEFWETFMEIKGNQKQKVRLESDARVTEQRMTIMKQKAKKLEKRATRCGFCPPGAKRSQLVSFCVHCRKHLCGMCSSAHGSDSLFKHHGTVDLSKDKNTALL